MKTMVFWVLVISMMFQVAAFSTVTVHFVPLMVWKERFKPREGADLLGAFAFVDLRSITFVLGWIADK